MNIESFKCFAIDNGFDLDEVQPDKSYLRFKRGKELLDIWVTTGTIRYIKKPWFSGKHFRNLKESDYSNFFQKDIPTP